MKRTLKFCLAVALCSLAWSGTALAWHFNGNVLCEQGNQLLGGVTINVVATSGGPYSASGTTDASGNFSISLLDRPACYTATIVLPPGGSYVTPANGEYNFCTTDVVDVVNSNFIIDAPNCVGESGACWLTGGGAKFSNITGSDLGEVAKVHNWGGNVNPGCSPTAGDGGSWNHIDAQRKLHFHGTHIEVVRCGNVDGIPPGSTSPVTPFNFIEYTGWGTLKGIQGNKVDYGTVYFFARAEDRNEPGSNGQRDGDGKDRYFLNVYTVQGAPATSVLLVDQDGIPTTVDPLVISKGNMQIHISSCEVTPTFTVTRSTGPNSAEAATEPAAAPGSWGRIKVIYR